MSFPFDNRTPRRSVRIAERTWRENFLAATRRIRANFTAVKEAPTPEENVRATLYMLDGLMTTDRIVLAHPLTRHQYRSFFDSIAQRYYVTQGDIIARACAKLHQVMDREIQEQEAMIRQWDAWKAAGLIV
jgi:hypothetical protein